MKETIEGVIIPTAVLYYSENSIPDPVPAPAILSSKDRRAAATQLKAERKQVEKESSEEYERLLKKYSYHGTNK